MMQQLPLWNIEPELPHQHIRVRWLGGREEVYCAAHDYRPETRPGEWEWEAGYLGLPVRAEECRICRKDRRGRDGRLH